MKLLILTQAVDSQDPVLGFFHRWIEELAKTCESVHVICLKEGAHDLPKNVLVHSLGKEQGASRLQYVWRFYRFIWLLRKEYDAVFVHMNPEYVVLGGILWRLMGKRVFLWRNHYQSGFLTDLAAPLCHKVFYTSRFSYTAKFRNAVQMPVGVDVAACRPDAAAMHTPRSILSLGRISPSKRIDVLIDALGILREHGVAFSADIHGSPLPQDEAYHTGLKDQAARLGLDSVQFHPGPRNADTPAIYASHDIFVNASRSGMYDKTIFEAAACGTVVVASSGDYAAEADTRCVFKDSDAADLARALEGILTLPPSEAVALRSHGMALAQKHSLESLMQQLGHQMRL